MSLDGLDLCCPACRGGLNGEARGGSLQCRACARQYPVIAGIPDLRLFADPYISLDDDRDKGRHLAERSAALSFEELVRYYYSITPAVPPAHAAAYARGLLTAEERASAALGQWEAAADVPAGGDLLEIGCGTAPVLAAAASRYRLVAGVDIAFRWLVVGRKRLEERGLDVPLVCACAEALPFRAPVADVGVFDSAIEHVDDQAAALAECRRVLRSGGRLFVSTPNRLSPGPDPHVGIWGGSLLPARWLAAWARRSGAVPPRRQLLHRGTLARRLYRAGFRNVRIFPPRLAREHVAALPGLRRRLATWYDRLVRFAPARLLLVLFGPVLYAVARADR